jgi:hypothetical protein
VRIHYILHGLFDLTYFSDNFSDVLQLLNYWVDLHQIFILHTLNKGFSFNLLFKVTEVY